MTLDGILENPRSLMVCVDCECGRPVEVGLPDVDAELPVRCSCGKALDDRAVLIANLQLARSETKALAIMVGTVLASMVHAADQHPSKLRKPLDAFRLVVDTVTGDSTWPSVADFRAAAMR